MGRMKDLYMDMEIFSEQVGEYCERVFDIPAEEGADACFKLIRKDLTQLKESVPAMAEKVVAAQKKGP